MKTSEQTNEIAAALAKAQGEMKNPEKNRTATIPIKEKDGGYRDRKYSFNYADLADVIDCTRLPLSKNGLSHSNGVRILENGACILTCRLSHSSGQWYESEYPLVKDAPTKELAADITYLRRYLLSGLIGIIGDEDTDAAEQKDGVVYTPKVTSKHTPASNPQRMVESAPTVNPGPIGGVSPLPPEAYDNGPNFEQYLERNVPKPGALSEKQITRLFAIAKAHGWENSDVRNYCMSKWEIASSKDLTRAQYDELIKWMETNPGQVK